ncbi:MAG: ferrochelatase [Candidatus Aenigmarchaeota archaeon]|nr:ferrochelatase [Candidatus Aenigmarchaeota archaeon]
MKGVLLMGYGSPETESDVTEYFTDIRGHVPGIAEIESLKERYRKIGRSPLLEITLRQAKALQALLGKDYAVYVGMKHWKPYLRDALEEMEKDGIQEAVAIAMTPYFSSMSVGSYMKLVEGKTRIKINFVKSWCRNGFFLRAVEEKLNAIKDGSPVIFTAHSLPERILEIKDPYVDEIRETCAKIAAMAGPL